MGLLDFFRPRTSEIPPAFGPTDRVGEVQQVLTELRPLFQADGGDMQLIGVHDDGRVELRPVGACNGCSVSRLTLDGAVAPRLKERCDWFQGLAVSSGSAQG